MKRLIYIITVILIMFTGISNAYENRIALDIISVSEIDTLKDLPIFWSNDATIIQAQIGLRVSASQGTVVWFEEGMEYIDSTSRGGVLPDALVWSFRYEGPEGYPDTALVIAGSYSPPIYNGIPAGGFEPIHHLCLGIGGNWGEICIDSVASVPPDDGWLWDDGSGNMNPEFELDGSSHCFVYEWVGWIFPEYITVPQNDILLDYDCKGASFTFNIWSGSAGAQIDDVFVLSGIGSITEVGEEHFLYEAPPSAEGSYPITIRTYNSFPCYIDYTFTLILSKACGDANGDCLLNISDAVYIINYVFAGGQPPDPYENGDCNCDLDVNVSDAVWIINYVFMGGNFPCDTDGDVLPDC